MSKDRTISQDELERKWNKMSMTCFKVLLGITEKTMTISVRIANLWFKI